MITGQLQNKIKELLLKAFPEAQCIKEEQVQENYYYQTFCLFLSKGKKVVLKFSKDYLEQNSFEEFSKHLQRNIYYVIKSNINRTIYLLKNFEIEVTGYVEPIHNELR
jgi:hypothetical protein